MKIEQLITLTENKLMTLNQAVASATTAGNVEELSRLDAEVQDTQETLNTIRGLI